MATTVVEMATRLLPMADRELVKSCCETLKADGITMLTGVKTQKLWKEKDRSCAHVRAGRGPSTGKSRRIASSCVSGRKPDVEGLVLEKAGVDYTARGIITDNRLRTSAPNIYACGDIVGPYQLASTAEYQGMVAATNAVLPMKRKVDYRNNVYVIFTDPPLAYMGLTEEEAHRKYGHKVKSLSVRLCEHAPCPGRWRRGRGGQVPVRRQGPARGCPHPRRRGPGGHPRGPGDQGSESALHELHAVTHAYPTYAQALVGRASQLAYLDKMSG